MTKNKKFSLILTLLLCFVVSFGAMGMISVRNASAEGYPFRYDNSVSDEHKMEKYYTSRWAVGQDQRAGDETSGKWSFGKAILHTDSQTYNYVKATKVTPSDAGGDTMRYATGGPHQLMWGFDVLTDVASGNTDTAYQTVFAWEAEAAGTVKFTGFYSRKNSSSSNMTALAGADSGWTDFWIPGINTAEVGNGFTSGENYTTAIFKYSPTAEGNKLTCETYKQHTSEYVWTVNPTTTYTVKAGDIIFFGLLCTNKGGIADGWYTNTLGLFSSQFTAAAPVVVQRTLTVNCGTGGSVTGITNGQKVNNNTAVTPSVSANTGYVIDSLSWGGTAISDASGKTSYSLGSKTITADTTLTVTFKKATYNVTLTNDNAKGTVTGLSETYEHGDTASVTITPLSGYKIATAKWNGSDITGFNESGFSFTQTVTGASTLAVTYTNIKYNLTVTNDTAKGIIEGAQSKEYNANTTLNITVTPESGYRIATVKWNGSDVSEFNENGFTFTKTINAESTLVVTYTQITYMITVNNDSTKGTVSLASGEQAMNQKLDITITPKSGFEIASVTWGSTPVTVSDPNGLTFSKFVDGEKTLTVTYQSVGSSGGEDPVKKTYKVLATFDKDMGTVTGIGTFEEGKLVTVTIKAKDGYQIKSVKDGTTELKIKDSEKGTFKYTFTLTSTTTIKVEFESASHATTYKNGAACLNSINGGEYVAIISLVFAVAGLAVMKIKKKEQ